MNQEEIFEAFWVLLQKVIKDHGLTECKNCTKRCFEQAIVPHLKS